MEKELRRIFVNGLVEELKGYLQGSIVEPEDWELYFHQQRMTIEDLPVSVRKESRAWLWERGLLTQKLPISIDEVCEMRFKRTYKKPSIVVAEGYNLIAICTDNYGRSRWMMRLVRELKEHLKKVDAGNNKILCKNGAWIKLVISDDKAEEVFAYDRTTTVYRQLI